MEFEPKREHTLSGVDKSKVLKELKKNVSEELEKLKETYGKSRAFANDEDMKADSKWDTRATEAKYLAEGQLKRIDELEQETALLDQIETKPLGPDDEVSLGALMEIELNGHKKYYFLSNTAGGTLLKIDGKAILVISVFSPIGNEVLGLNLGDSFELETPREVREYTISGLW